MVRSASVTVGELDERLKRGTGRWGNRMKNRDASMKRVRKAVIPVAGLGTRFLPATKAMPKEMLTVVDRPVVQYAVDEAREAGIDHIVFVTGRNKQVIEDYFDVQPELLDALAQAGKTSELATLNGMQPPAGMMSFTRQQAPLGLGHAVWCARDIIGDEPSRCSCPTWFPSAKGAALPAPSSSTRRTGGNVIAVEQCDPLETARYGIVGRGRPPAPASRSPAWSRSPTRQPRPPTTTSTAATCCSRRSSRSSARRSAAPETKSSSPTPCSSFRKQEFFAHALRGPHVRLRLREGFIQANVAFALARDDIRDLVFEPIAEMLSLQTKPRRAA